MHKILLPTQEILAMDTNPLSKFAEQMMAANQQVVSSTIRLNQMAMEVESELLRHRMSYLDTVMRAEGIDWTDVKTPAEWVAKSNEISAAYGESISAWLRKSMELEAELRKKLTDAYQEEMTKTTDVMRGAVPEGGTKQKSRARTKPATGSSS